MKKKHPRDHETRKGREHASQSVLPPGIAHGERNQQEMRQGEPDCADLVRSRRSRIQKAPRDIEVRLGVPVVQRVVVLDAPPGRTSSHGGQQQRDAGLARKM